MHGRAKKNYKFHFAETNKKGFQFDFILNKNFKNGQKR